MTGAIDFGKIGPLLRTACPQDGSTGPHNILQDFPDDHLPAQIVLQCADCGFEWAVDIPT